MLGNKCKCLLVSFGVRVCLFGDSVCHARARGCYVTSGEPEAVNGGAHTRNHLDAPTISKIMGLP